MTPSIISAQRPHIDAFLQRVALREEQPDEETPYDHRVYCQDQIDRFERIARERPLTETELSDLDYYASELEFEEYLG